MTFNAERTVITPSALAPLPTNEAQHVFAGNISVQTAAKINGMAVKWLLTADIFGYSRDSVAAMSPSCILVEFTIKSVNGSHQMPTKAAIEAALSAYYSEVDEAARKDALPGHQKIFDDIVMNSQDLQGVIIGISTALTLGHFEDTPHGAPSGTSSAVGCCRPVKRRCAPKK